MRDRDFNSIPDTVSLKEAIKDDEHALVFSSKNFFKRNAFGKPPCFDLDRYICFHKDLRFGVYKYKNQYYLAKKTWGRVITKVNVINKHGDGGHWKLLKASINGATFLNKGSESEQLFLQYIVEKQKDIDEITVNKKDIARAEKHKARAEKHKARAEKHKARAEKHKARREKARKARAEKHKARREKAREEWRAVDKWGLIKDIIKFTIFSPIIIVLHFPRIVFWTIYWLLFFFFVVLNLG